MKKLLLTVLVVVLALVAVVLWLADRPIDQPPQLHEGAGAFAFHPKFGPKTPQKVQEYLEYRAARHWGGRKLTPADLQTPDGKAAWADAVDTLQRRWGLRPGMTQDEIDTVRAQQEKVWEYVENTRTTRYKIRSWFGMNS